MGLPDPQILFRTLIAGLESTGHEAPLHHYDEKLLAGIFVVAGVALFVVLHGRTQSGEDSFLRFEIFSIKLLIGPVIAHHPGYVVFSLGDRDLCDESVHVIRARAVDPSLHALFAAVV